MERFSRMNPVWIIDDDRSIRWVFEKALAREGIAHRTFGAAQEALDSLPQEAPQVVVSDIRMPGISGLDFMHQLKTRLPSTPVIIMTAYSDLESAVAAFQGGAFEYLPKPFDLPRAVELIRGSTSSSLPTRTTGSCASATAAGSTGSRSGRHRKARAIRAANPS